MSKTYIIGDIHGAHKALEQVLDRSPFDPDKDRLITLGDYADGWHYVYEAVEMLLAIPNRISLLGNHDDWFVNWLQKGIHPVSWLQGGEGTAMSYIRNADRDIEFTPRMGGFFTNLTACDIPESHKEFWMSLKPYHVDGNRCFVHGGFDRNREIADQDIVELIWNRDLWNKALSCKDWKVKLKNQDNFDEIFIGHTTTMTWRTDQPMEGGGVWNLDTGAGFWGRLTIMDLETKEYWQSDRVQDELYPGERGR